MQIEPLFLLQGRAGSVHPYPNALETEVLEVIASGLGNEYQGLARQKIGALECPIHHRRATVTIVNVTYAASSQCFEGESQIDTCCAEFRQTIAAHLL